MAFRYWYKNDDGDLVEFTDRVQVGWANNPGTDGLTMDAEEGAIGVSSIRVEDPDGDWDFPRGHRIVYVLEDEAEYDDFGGVIYKGYTAARKFERDVMRTEAARIITVDLQDINIIFDRRIMVGAENNRPAETDVERITWLLTTNEAALIDDYTYFSTDGPVDMDAVDYRGQSFRNILSDCSLQSGKNWYLWPSLGGFSLWYQPRGTEDFTSDLRISNVLADVDEYEETYAPAIDSVLTRDPDRVYSGIYRSYANSYLYTQNEDTAMAFARRDTSASSPNVKTKLKALVRNERELYDISTEEDVITTSIIVPRTKANGIVPGHRVQVKYTHFPSYEDDYVWLRVLDRTIRELGPDQLELALTLTRDEPAVDTSGVGAIFAIIARPKGYDYLDRLYYQWEGNEPETGGGYQPKVGLVEVLADAGSPLAPTWNHYGFKILGTGTVDLQFNTSTIGITPTSVTFSILKNGVSIYDLTQFNGGSHGNDCGITLEDVPVDVDDILTTAIHCDPPGTPFFQAPRGTGTNNEYFRITSGNVT